MVKVIVNNIVVMERNSTGGAGRQWQSIDVIRRHPLKYYYIVDAL